METLETYDDEIKYALIDGTDYLGDVGKGEPIDFEDARIGAEIGGNQFFIPVE